MFSKCGSLNLVPVFEKFLNNIVSKYIIHQTVCFRKNLRKNKFFFLFCGDIILLLNESRSILIHRAFHDMILDVSYLYLLSILNLTAKILQELTFCNLDYWRHWQIIIHHIIRLLVLLLHSSCQWNCIGVLWTLIHLKTIASVWRVVHRVCRLITSSIVIILSTMTP